MRMSNNQSFAKRNIRTILNIVTFGLLGLVLYAARDQFEAAYENLFNVNLWWVLAVVPLQALNFHIYARMYQHFFKILGNTVPYKFMYRTVLELNFVNHVLPSGGASGFSYFSIAMRKRKVAASKSTLVQTMRFAAIFLSFLLLQFIALLFLGIDGKASNFLVLVAASVTTLLVVGTGLIAFVIGTKSRINSFFTFLTRTLNKIIQIVRPKHPETINIQSAKNLFNEFHDNYMKLRSDMKRLRPSFWHGFFVNLTELLSVYVIFLAFGTVPNFGVVIIAYSVANFAGLLSPLPGGAGAYEFLMVSVLTAGGIPVNIGLPVVVMFRVVALIIQIPIGAYWYHQTLRRIGK